jgi:hypothetical protein
MNNPQLQAQKPAVGWRCIRGEDLGIRRIKCNEVGMLWNKLISLNIKGRMKKAQYSMMSRGRTGGMSRLSTALLSGGGSSPLKPRGSLLFPGEGSDLVPSLKAQIEMPTN